MGHRSLKECFSLKNKEIIPHTDKLIKVLKNVQHGVQRGRALRRR